MDMVLERRKGKDFFARWLRKGRRKGDERKAEGRRTRDAPGDAVREQLKLLGDFLRECREYANSLVRFPRRLPSVPSPCRGAERVRRAEEP